MRNLISTKPERVMKWISEKDYMAHCGCLRSPVQPSYIQELCEKSYVWACDNDCFTGYRPERIRRFLDRFQDYASLCQFFNCPDVIEHRNGIDYGNARATLERFAEWQPKIHKLGWRVAFTIQNGMEQHVIPWDDFEALFIGASDDWRYGTHRSYVRETVHEALSRGKWVHVGRVNTIRRIAYWRDMGVSSFDGTGYTLEPRKTLSTLAFHAFPIRQLSLWR